MLCSMRKGWAQEPEARLLNVIATSDSLDQCHPLVSDRPAYRPCTAHCMALQAYVVSKSGKTARTFLTLCSRMTSMRLMALRALWS